MNKRLYKSVLTNILFAGVFSLIFYVLIILEFQNINEKYYLWFTFIVLIISGLICFLAIVFQKKIKRVIIFKELSILIKYLPTTLIIVAFSSALMQSIFSNSLLVLIIIILILFCSFIYERTKWSGKWDEILQINIASKKLI